MDILTKAVEGLMASGFPGIVLVLLVYVGFPRAMAIVDDLKRSQKENADRCESSNKALADKLGGALDKIALALAANAKSDLARYIASPHVVNDAKEALAATLQDIKKDFPDT